MSGSRFSATRKSAPSSVSALDTLKTPALPSLTRVVIKKTGVISMAGTRLTKLEFQIIETLWNQGEASIREMQEAFPEKRRPGYTTVQKMVYRMEAKKVVRRVRKVGNFHVFAAA